MLDALASFLFSYLLHSSVLIGLALAADRLGLLRRLSCELTELVWRWALFGGLLTAGLQPLLNHREMPSNVDVTPRPAIVMPVERVNADRPVAPAEPVRAQAEESAAPLLQTVEPLLKPLAGLLTLLWLYMWIT